MEFLLDGIMAVLGPGGWKMIAMYIVGIALIVLAVKKEYEPSLLLPLGFGAILVNLPYSGVIDQLVPVSYTHLDVYKRQHQTDDRIAEVAARFTRVAVYSMQCN